MQGENEMDVKNIDYCHKCLMPDTRPRVVFNEEGICNACLNMEEKNSIDWDQRKKEFIQCLKLREIKSDSIDMFTVLIIGSSQTKSFTKNKESTNVYTPRGYKLEKNRGIA